MEKFNATKYKNDFQKEKYDRIIVNVSKGKRVEIDDFRKTKGYTSLNAFINDLIEQCMNSEQVIIHAETIEQNGDNNTINIG